MAIKERKSFALNDENPFNLLKVRELSLSLVFIARPATFSPPVAPPSFCHFNDCICTLSAFGFRAIK